MANAITYTGLESEQYCSHRARSYRGRRGPYCHCWRQFSELFVAYLLSRNSRIEEDLIDQLFNSSEKRLARLLLILANFGKEGAPQPINPNINQETLADMIGATRSRVSSFMNKFRKLGLISYNGKIEVHSSMLSAVLREAPRIRKDKSASGV
jgi:CRP/FNR family transcriptional regulator, cyclic AMP receptor protein